MRLESSVGVRISREESVFGRAHAQIFARDQPSGSGEGHLLLAADLLFTGILDLTIV
jgi:hypothetical protein